MPDQVHNALAAENPAYAALTITQQPSWVRDPSTYPSGASSLSVSFEDPDGTSAQSLLCLRTPYAFGHVITVKRWKKTPPKRKTINTPAPRGPRANTSKTPGVNTPADSGFQPSLYTDTPSSSTFARQLASRALFGADR